MTVPDAGPDAGRAADVDELVAVAVAAARAGTEVARGWRARADELLVREKAAPDDLVSQADADAEAAVRAVIADHRPDDAVLGEEAGATPGRSGVEWHVDPIDGTTNYLYGRPDWAVSVAAAAVGARLLAAAVAEPALDRLTVAGLGRGTRADGRPVAAAVRGVDLHRVVVEVNLGRPAQKGRAGRMVDALVPRVRDLRRAGSAASALAQLVTGRADAVWLPGLQPWDIAAGALLAHEAGYVVGDLDGPTPGTWPVSGDVLAAPPDLWPVIRDLIAGAYA